MNEEIKKEEPKQDPSQPTPEELKEQREKFERMQLDQILRDMDTQERKIFSVEKTEIIETSSKQPSVVFTLKDGRIFAMDAYRVHPEIAKKLYTTKKEAPENGTESAGN
jgi:hypothetical protein